MKKFLVLFLGAAAAVSLMVNIGTSDNASANSLSKAREIRNNMCPQYNNLFFDYVWMTAPNGSTQVTVPYGQTSVQVTAHIYGYDCKNTHTWGWVGSRYSPTTVYSVPGFLSGTAARHTRSSANPREAYRTQSVTINIRNLQGKHCPTTIVNATDTYLFGQWPDFVPVPSATWCLQINRYYDWQLRPDITMVGSANQPGQSVSWRHQFTNIGTQQKPSGTEINLYARNNRHIGSGQADQWLRITGGLAAGSTSSNNRTSSYAVKQKDVGNSVCRITRVSPRAWNNSSPRDSGVACRPIPYNYNLNPSIQNVPKIAVPGQNLAVQGRVTNEGPTKSYRADTRFVRIIYPAEGAAPSSRATGTRAGQPTAANACAFYGAPAGSCSVYNPTSNHANYVFNHASGDNAAERITDRPYNFDANIGIPQNLNPGDKVCYAIAVSGYNASTGSGKTGTRYSALSANTSCATVGKTPSVQVWGGSLSAGRSFDGLSTHTADVAARTTTITRDLNRRIFGSWSEYGIFATGTITHIASGSGLNMPNGHTQENQSSWSSLSFTNRAASLGGVGYGSYVFQNQRLPNLDAIFAVTTGGGSGATPVIPDAQSRTPSQLAGSCGGSGGGRVVTGSGTVGTPGSLIISAGELARGCWAVVNAPNTHVTISGDISYADGPFREVSEIPQLIIIARTITINNSVTNIDAWLIARDAISTCQQRGGVAQTISLPGNYQASGARLSMNDCDEALRVNGPVATNKLYLRRTAGATVDRPGQPAEVFNLRPDAYLWINSRLSDNRIYRTTATYEVPPRY